MNKYYPIQYIIIEQYSDYLEEVIWIEGKSSTISSYIGQILFERGDIRNFCDRSDELVNVSEDDSNRQLILC